MLAKILKLSETLKPCIHAPFHVFKQIEQGYSANAVPVISSAATAATAATTVTTTTTATTQVATATVAQVATTQVAAVVQVATVQVATTVQVPNEAGHFSRECKNKTKDLSPKNYLHSIVPLIDEMASLYPPHILDDCVHSLVHELIGHLSAAGGIYKALGLSRKRLFSREDILRYLKSGEYRKPFDFETAKPTLTLLSRLLHIQFAYNGKHFKDIDEVRHTVTIV